MLPFFVSAFRQHSSGGRLRTPCEILTRDDNSVRAPLQQCSDEVIYSGGEGGKKLLMRAIFLSVILRLF